MSFLGNSTQDTRSPYEVAILVVPKYSQLSLSALVEPLRMANTMAGRKLYTWTLFSPGGGPVRSSSDLSLAIENDIYELAVCDALFVVASYDVFSQITPRVLAVLRRLARAGTFMGALDAGGYFLAEAGLLDGCRATTHWDGLEDFRHRYRRIETVSDRYVFDGQRATTSGSLPSFDFTLEFIRRRDGLAIAGAVSGNFIYDHPRPGSEPQSVISISHLRDRNPKIAAVLKLMETRMQDPLDTPELALAVGWSERTFLRRFRKAMNMTPQVYYRALRLDAGKRLLENSGLSIEEIAIACGFKTRGAFTRAFRKKYGRTPSDHRNEREA